MGLNCRDWAVLLERVVVSPIYDKFASKGMWFRQPNIQQAVAVRSDKQGERLDEFNHRHFIFVVIVRSF